MKRKVKEDNYLPYLGSKYEIIAGERRYKAATLAGLTEVPAIVGSMDDQTSAELALIENIQRKDLSAIEEAKSYKKILDMGNFTQDELAKRMGKSQSTIANKMRLLALTNEVQVALMNNLISERHARCLLQIKDEDKQKEVLNKIITEKEFHTHENSRNRFYSVWRRDHQSLLGGRPRSGRFDRRRGYHQMRNPDRI